VIDMAGKFILKKTPRDFFRFSLVTPNCMTILTSKNFSTKAECLEGLKLFKENTESEIEDKTLQKTVKLKSPRFEIYFDEVNLYRYRLIAEDGVSVATSEEGYPTKSSCIKGIKAIPAAVEDAQIDESFLAE